MTAFTVEATTGPVRDEDGWFPLRRITDLIPGTILIEDADEPVLILPVSASSTGRAALFVDGVLKMLGIELIGASIEQAEDDGSAANLSPEAQEKHALAESCQI